MTFIINQSFNMKKITIGIASAAMLLSSAAPALAGGSVDIPTGSIGVSAEQLQRIREAHCAYEMQPGYIVTPLGRYCDPVIGTLEGTVIHREDTGAMFWINTADGLPGVNRYLPNGFYKVNRNGKMRYYWVSNGVRLKLHMKEDLFAQITQRIVDSPQYSAVPVSDSTFSDLEAAKAIYANPTYHAQLVHRLNGSVVMRVEHDGSLYYVNELASDTDIKGDIVNISPKNVKTIVQDFATPVQWNVMKKLVAARHL